MDGLADLPRRLAGWLAPLAAVALVLGIPWLMGWMALELSR